MAEAYYRIPQARKRRIREYLKGSDCSPAQGGYNVLYHIISIAADHPEYSSRELFAEYVRHVSFGKEENWRTPYNLALYCFHNAVTNARSLYAFIREGAMEVTELQET